MPSAIHDKTGSVIPLRFELGEPEATKGQVNLTRVRGSPRDGAPQIGATFVDNVDIPQLHFGIKGHPLEQELDTAVRKEIQTIFNMGCLGPAITPKELPDGYTLVDSMLVLKARADEKGIWVAVKARLTLRGDQMAEAAREERAKSLNSPKDSPVFSHITLRLLSATYAAAMDVLTSAADLHSA